VPATLFQFQGFGGAFVDAYAAVDAGFGIYAGLFGIDLYGLGGAGFDAVATSGAGLKINGNWHKYSPCSTLRTFLLQQPIATALDIAQTADGFNREF